MVRSSLELELTAKTRLFIFITLVFFLIFYSQGDLNAGEAPKDSCVTCHSDMHEEMKSSVHSRHAISCHFCHGGDSAKTDKELAKAPGTGYIGVPDKKQIADKCGSCHADVEMMNFYGIATDQLARYKTSVHGKKLLLENDARVAVCSDCHGYHDVLPITDPQSSVYPLNIPKTCAHCHANGTLMARYNLSADIFKTYQGGVHGRALLENKDLSAPHCASCHGSHGAVPPGVKNISTTCGKCHTNEKKFFLESPHAKLIENGQFSECVSCHGFHGVKKASLSLYGESCLKCHDSSSVAIQTGHRISQALETSSQALSEAAALVKQASADGIFVEDENALLEEAKTNVIAMGPAQHSLSAGKILELQKNVFKSTQEIKTKIDAKRQGLRWRKAALIPLWIFVFVMAVALWAQYKRLSDLHHRGKK